MEPALEHRCSSKQCPCSRFSKIHPSTYPIISSEISKELPLELLGMAHELDGETWLHMQDVDGVFGIGCSICAKLLAECGKDIIAKYGITCVNGLKPFRLKARACSENHIAAVMRLLAPNDSVGLLLSQETEAPPASGFEALMTHIRKGGSLRDGLPGVGHFRKIKCMTFILAEAFRRFYRQHLQHCYSINLLRDEAFSFAGAFPVCQLAGWEEHRSDWPGQSGEINSHQLDWSYQVFVPGLLHWCLTLTCWTTCATVHALTVEAAGNEVASRQNMRSNKSVTADNAKAFAPNLQVIIRDKAHASRRILERRPRHVVYGRA